MSNNNNVNNSILIRHIDRFDSETDGRADLRSHLYTNVTFIFAYIH